MVASAVFAGYNLLVGVATALGVVYFLVGKPAVVEYRRFLLVTSAGLVLFLVGGPITEFVAPVLVHWIHGVAALLLVAGLYDPLDRELRTEAWSEVLLEDPGQVRQPADWMVPADDAVLELFHDTELALTPSIVAYNIGYTREVVNRRLRTLEAHGFVTRVERGKYRITHLGSQYVQGSISTSLRGSLRYLWSRGDRSW